MEKEDARFQTLEQLHERRKQVIQLYRKRIKVMQRVMSYFQDRRVRYAA